MVVLASLMPDDMQERSPMNEQVPEGIEALLTDTDRETVQQAHQATASAEGREPERSSP
jgi:hypothetical protein